MFLTKLITKLLPIGSIRRKYLVKAYNLATFNNSNASTKKYISHASNTYDKSKRTILISLEDITSIAKSNFFPKIIKTLKDRYNIIFYAEKHCDNLIVKEAFLIIKNITDPSLRSKVLSEINNKYNLCIVLTESITDQSILNNASDLKIPTLLLLTENSNIETSIDTLVQNILSANRIIVSYEPSYISLIKQLNSYLSEQQHLGDCITLPEALKSISNNIAKNKEFTIFINEQISYSTSINQENIEVIKILVESKCFDNNYMKIFKSKEESAYFYTKTQRKNLYKACPNPAPGFSTSKWLSMYNLSKIPMYEAILKGVCTTHTCNRLDISNVTLPQIKLAVHLHLFYSDLAQEFCNYFKNIPLKYDLYITTVESNNIEDIRNTFKGCGANQTKIITVDNIGRDIGPMIFNLKDIIKNENYEIIGHFHSKKSLAINDDTGNKWRKYLLDNLIGNNAECTKHILGLFNNKELGLLFPENKNFIDIGKNQKHIDSLCKMLELNKITHTPLFPVGNMYWARVNAIKDIFNLNMESVLEKEPLANDGSYMHALERILPNIVTKNNYKYETIYMDRTDW